MRYLAIPVAAVLAGFCPIAAMAAEDTPTATTVTVQGDKTTVTTAPAPKAEASATTVVVAPEDGPRDAITGELIVPKEATPEEMSLRDKVRSELKEDPADQDKVEEKKE